MTLLRPTGLFFVLVHLAICSASQPLTESLKVSSTPPANLLNARSVALYDYLLTSAELSEFQRGFQRIGIDAIAYFTTDVVMAGKDPQKAYSEYFQERQITNLVILEKGSFGYRFTATAFNNKQSLVDAGQTAWQVSQPKLNDLLTTILQDAWRAQKKSNYLINEFPETDIAVDVVKGRRQEFYAIDLKVDNLAVPKFGDPAQDAVLEKFFAEHYPLRYKLVEAGSDEQELRRKGFLYILCFVHARGEAAKEAMGYDLSKGEKSYASITYPDGQLQLKILPKEEVVYKFYFRHIDNGNVFLGTKWDADTSWLDALRNHVVGFKQEAKIN